MPILPRGLRSLAPALLVAAIISGAGTAAAQQGAAPVAALASITPTVPDVSRADLDTTVAPCEDFFQYATGGWYASIPRAEREETAHGPDQARAGVVLRQLVARAPAMASTTKDPTLRAVGYFYGSCLADASGAADGVAGDTARASFCFRETRRHMERALFELLMEYVWPPSVRAEVRRFWPNMQAAAIDLVQQSAVLPDSTKRQLIELTSKIRLYASETNNPGRDSTTELWRPESTPPSPAGRRPSDIPFIGDIGATWTYRNYASFQLSPTDFTGNLARLQAAPDTLPPPALPGPRERRTNTQRVLLDMVLGDETFDAGVGREEAGAPLGMLIPPVIDGKVDLAAWYGMVGPVMGHEMSHGTIRGGGQRTPLTVLSDSLEAAFAEELFRGQLQHFSHPFDDSFGLLIAYGAFKRAMADTAWPSIDGFTPEQRFFLGVARGWRGGPATVSPISNGQTRWRVMTNGTLSAMPAFAKAFGCKADGAMTGKRIWYEDPWQGTAALTAQRRRDLYQDYAGRVFRQAAQTLMADIKLTREQQTRIRELGPEQQARVLALADSLVSVADSIAAHRRIHGLLAELYGARRAVLTREQQAVFDQSARAWMREQAAAGTPVAIPGVQ